MSGELGKGDVVVATTDQEPFPPWYEYHVTKGDRGIVSAVVTVRTRGVPGCLCGSPFGLKVEPFSLLDDLAWCACQWRKIGGSQADTVRRFAEDLNLGKPLTPAKTPEPEIA